MTEDKVTLTQKRAELVESFGCTKPALTPEERVRVQGELSIVNAKIKALNTTQAAQLKAAADRRKAAGLAEAQANALRARAALGGPTVVEDTDTEQTAAIDGWIDAVLLRNDVAFNRTRASGLTIEDATQAPVIKILIDGIYAAARGQELPDLPREAPQPPKKTKVQSKKG